MHTETYVVVTEKVDVTRVVISGGSGVGEVNQSILSSELFGCTWIPRESCARRTEFRGV